MHRAQILEMAGKLPDRVVACVGGGSNAIGMFHPFVGDVDAGDVKLVGVEAGGKGMDALNSATLTQGRPGVLHGTRTYLLQVQCYSVAAAAAAESMYTRTAEQRTRRNVVLLFSLCSLFRFCFS